MLHHVVIGEGRPVLILHGARLDHRHMRETCEPVFADCPGWRRIYVDMPGHGQSGGGEKIATQADLLDAVIEFASTGFPDERLAIIGESRGSYIASGFACLRPDLVRGLALIVPGGSPSAPPDRLPAHVTLVAAPELRSELAEAELPRFDGLVVQNREIMEKARRTIVPAIPLSDAEMAERLLQNFDFPFAITAPEALFDKPCLIVAGRQDSMSGYLDAVGLLSVYPRATLAVLDSAGHKVAWERPDAFAALMRDWLERLERAEG